ncbi:MAG: PIN domain-containing protein [Methanotrichaceae archaeon]
MRLFEDFLKNVTLLSFSQPTADIASEIYADLSNKGKPISSCDVLIGATAIENKLPIVAEDKHFKHIDDLRCGLKRKKWVMA